MTRPQRRPAVAAPSFEPGHFLELVRRHNWPPRFVPQMPVSRTPNWSAISTANRERRQAHGDTGTIVGLTQRADDLMLQRVLAHKARRARP
jgi:hypothetical protein